MFASLMLTGASSVRPVVISAIDPWTTWTGAADAPYILASSSVGRAQVWDTRKHVAVRTFENVRQAVLSPDAQLIAANLPGSGEVRVMRVDDEAVIARIVAAHGAQTALAISPDDELVAVDEFNSDADGIVVANARSGATVYRLPATAGGAVFSPDGATLATLEPKRRDVLLWDARSGRFKRRLRGDAGVFGPPLFSPDGRYLLTVANPPRTPPHSDGSFAINSIDYPALQLEVWDCVAGRVVRQVPFWDDQGYTYDESPGFFAFADTGRVVASSRVGSAVVADIATGVVRRIDARGFVVRGGSAVEIIDADAWSELSGETPHLVLHFAQLLDLTNMAVSADGLVATAAGNRVFVWDLAHAVLRCSGALDGPVNYLSFTSGGDIGVQANGSLRIDSSKCKAAGRYLAAKPNDGILSPDGSRELRFAPPATSSKAPSLLEVRAARTHKLLATVPGIISGDPSGPRFALRAPVAVLQTNHSPQEIIVLDATSGRTRLEVAASSFALSPDGATLAVASRGDTIFYDTSTGRITGRITERSDCDGSIFSFLPGGTTLVALTAAGTLRVCTLAGRTIATLSALATTVSEPVGVIDLPNGDYAASATGVAFMTGGRADAAAVRAILAPAVRATQ